MKLTKKQRNGKGDNMGNVALIISVIIYCSLMTGVLVAGNIIQGDFSNLALSFVLGAITTLAWLIITAHVCGYAGKEKNNEHNN
jgi:hypothetical protein